MKYIKVLALTPLMLWVPSAICQHLPSVPSFCTDELCIDSGPVVSGDALNYPSFTFFKKDASQIVVYIIKYRDFGYVSVTMSPLRSASCAGIDKKKVAASNIMGNTTNYNQKLCRVMPNGRAYLLQISLHGLDLSRGRDLCDQALTGLWAFDSFSSSPDKYKSTYTRIDFNLKCRETGTSHLRGN